MQPNITWLELTCRISSICPQRTQDLCHQISKNITAVQAAGKSKTWCWHPREKYFLKTQKCGHETCCWREMWKTTIRASQKIVFNENYSVLAWNFTKHTNIFLLTSATLWELPCGAHVGSNILQTVSNSAFRETCNVLGLLILLRFCSRITQYLGCTHWKFISIVENRWHSKASALLQVSCLSYAALRTQKLLCSWQVQLPTSRIEVRIGLMVIIDENVAVLGHFGTAFDGTWRWNVAVE